MFHKLPLKIIGIVLGIAAIVMAVSLYSMDVGSYENNQYYGGDAYTGMQQASAQAANNVMYTGKMIRTGLSALLMLHGCILLLGSLCINTRKEAPAAAPVASKPAEPAPVQQPAAPAVIAAPVQAEPVQQAEQTEATEQAAPETEQETASVFMELHHH